VTKVLELDDLSTGYLGVPVVRHLSMSVHAGEVVALLGPNGAGKTTTLLAISGINPVLAGRIEVFGRPVDKRKPHKISRSGLAHVPEDRSLFYQLTVRENLCVRSKDPSNIAMALSYFPALDGLMDRKAGLLSGGEQQMLAIGRALASGPRLLMVDELSLGLAPIIVEELLPVLRQIADDTGAGVLLVEQHVHMALEMADRAYVLSHGDLVLEGDSQHLRQNSHLLELSYLGEQGLEPVGSPDDAVPPVTSTGGLS
jgi:branched-chain amino acid transport system ATP-binding protein